MALIFIHSVYCVRCQFSLHLCLFLCVFFPILFMHIILYLHKIIDVQNHASCESHVEKDEAKKSEAVCKYGFDCTEIKEVEHPVRNFMCQKSGMNTNEMTSTWETHRNGAKFAIRIVHNNVKMHELNLKN